MRRSGRRPIKKEEKHFAINREIRAPELQIIDEDGQQLGVLPTAEAIRMAEERGYDLVEVFPTAAPPVAKFLDYGKFRYELMKAKQDQKDKQKKMEMKCLRLSLRIGRHDLERRRIQAGEFLQEGYKLRIEIILRGREKAHGGLARQIISQFLQDLQAEISFRVEQPVSFEAGTISVIINRT